MSDLLGIGISGLKVHQANLAITGHNITNADNEDYTRQKAIVSTHTAQNLGSGWIGNGVKIDDIQRIHDEFLVGQIRSDTSLYNELEAYSINSEAVDSLLADPNAGITIGLQNFFGALQSSVDDPSSVPARQVVLSEGEGLVERFNTLFDKFSDINTVINGQIETITQKVTTIAENVATLNNAIGLAKGSANGHLPNDLLDQRDAALKELSELVDIKVTSQDNNQINVFVGNGQVLVLGSQSGEIAAIDGAKDPFRLDLGFISGEIQQNVSRDITGGELGGILAFRDEILDPAFNALGRLALVIQDNFNEQQQKGLTLEGVFGQNLFSDINERETALARVKGDDQNASPQDRVLYANIDDAGLLTDSDYAVTFPGPTDLVYSITRVNDGVEVASGNFTNGIPDSVVFDGVELFFESGSFQQGDEFLVMPTRVASQSIDLNLTRPEDIAHAYPVSAEASLSNTGTGAIDQGVVFDTSVDYFTEEPNNVSPPLLVKFTSPSSYDVLDNSDPANPTALRPPIKNMTFAPGVSNKILPEDTGETVIESFGGAAPLTVVRQEPSPAAVVNAVNGFSPLRMTATTTNSVTGDSTTQPTLFIPENSSASEIATLLSDLQGVDASAYTTVQLTSFTSESNGFIPMAISVNGVNLSEELGPSQLKYDSSYPVTVPDPIDPNFLADRINANFELQSAGVTARSDGGTLTIESIHGDDIEVELWGDTGDSVEVSNGKNIELETTGARLDGILTPYSGYDFSQDGPYTFDFSMPDGSSYSIELTDNNVTAADVLNEISTKIQAEVPTTANINVSIAEDGQISFQLGTTLNGTSHLATNKIQMGGEVYVILDEGVTLSTEPPGSNVFAAEPTARPNYLGFQFEIDGLPEEGDVFTIGFNHDASADNRNGLHFIDFANQDTIGGNATYSESYGQMVDIIGSKTSQSQTNAEATLALLRQSHAARDSISGVNLDEEAANLIQFELAYNASAQVINVAKEIFDTLIATFR